MAKDAPKPRRYWVNKEQPISIGLRLEADEVALLDRACLDSGLKRATWVRGCVMRVLAGAPCFPHDQALALVQIRMELRRIGVAIRMLAARAQTIHAAEACIDNARAYHLEIRAQLCAVRDAVRGNLAYWEADDGR
ncbi:hypothetical protein P7B02_11530 [Caulobacter segnis]|uniref:hypothetical protein n=1 Tax=Caulobacter segnis TaxID=88688 RepID=UPI00240FFE57|nr:hypothetical protein [Caulobacter segnis]MDG2522172.1 hypothetical protein [Caulobacter segnis]